MNLRVLAFALLVGCGTEALDLPTQHEEASDFVPVPEEDKSDGLQVKFDKNLIMWEDFFLAESYLTADQLQAFLEKTPYDSRCWLADEVIDGRRASDVLVETSRERHLNPLMVLARMQVEQSLVSKTARPKQSKIDKAFGCGCPDNSSCNEKYKGLANQIRCAGDTLAKLHAGSMDGTGEWRSGTTTKTLDGKKVTPANDATAALYAYTPWVLKGEGGNWLVWNVTRRFDVYLAKLLASLPQPDAGPPTL